MQAPLPSILAALLLSVSGASLSAGAALADEPVTLKVMTFNIWYGGEQVNFAKVVEAIRLADPDIVGVQEPDGNLDRLAAATGLTYVDYRRNIISRYPLFDSGVGERTETTPSTYGVTALDSNALFDWVMVRPGKVVAAANTHLTSDPFGLNAVRNGATAAQVLEMENKLRVPDSKPFAALGKVGAGGVPVFLTGDFNSPSGLDWTAKAQAARHLPYALNWPATGVLLAGGLRDSYREAHPDPVAKPGLTWTPGMPNPYLPSDETKARIDFIFTAGPSKTVSSQIIGERNGPDVDIAVSPYPSDHRSVVSTFSVTPADAPALIAVEPPRVELGGTFMIRAYLPDDERHFSALVTPRGGGVSQALTGVVDEERPYRTGVRVSTHGMAAGDYDAILVKPNGEIAARTRFAVVAPGTEPKISVETPDVAQGEPLRVRWSGTRGNRFDWIGVYRAGDPGVMDNLTVRYTDAHLDGETKIDLVNDGHALAPGDYEVRLLNNNSYVVLASAPFKIRAR